MIGARHPRRSHGVRLDVLPESSQQWAASIEAATGAAACRLRIDAGGLTLDDVAIGDSIAVNGACLTVVSLRGRAFEVDVSRETLACIAGFDAGTPVNLEKALRLSDRLGGHLVSGHVDGVGTVERIEPVGDNRTARRSRCPQELARYIARKGSIAVNGVSLTVNEVSARHVRHEPDSAHAREHESRGACPAIA